MAHDKIDGVNFQNNFINNQNTSFEKVEGIIEGDFTISKITDEIFVPKGLPDSTPFNGFDFEKIEKDLFGNARKDANSVGAIIGGTASDPKILDKSKYGPGWFSDEKPAVDPVTHSVGNADELKAKIIAAKAGDIISLAAGNYSIGSSLVIDKLIHLQSKDPGNKSNIVFSGGADTPLFELRPRGELNLKGIKLTGKNQQYAFSNLKKNMSSLYNLSVTDSEISDFKYVLKAYNCLLYTSPSPRDLSTSRMPSSA